MKRKICTRKLDKLGRIVLPLEARTALKMNKEQCVNIFIDESYILIEKCCEVPNCVICKEPRYDLVKIDNVYMCPHCIKKVQLL